MRHKPLPSDYVGIADKSVHLEVVDGVLRAYRRRLSLRGRVRSETLERETDLTQVRCLNWYISPFSREGTIRVTLWDRPTTFEMLFDVTPQDKEARELGEFRAPDLRTSPTAHQAFLATLAPRLEAGLISSTLDLETLRPLAPNSEPAPGVFRTDKKFVYDPHLARTEQQMRAERDQ